MKIHVPQLFDKDPIYVEGMTNYQTLTDTREGLVEFGAVAATGNSTLQAPTAATAGVRVDLAEPILVDPNFGRTVGVTSGGATTVTLYGRDYLNQFMSQAVVLGSATTVASLKAFKYIDAYVSTATTTVGLGRGAGLGLPFVAISCVREYEDGAAAAAGTLTAPVATTPSVSTGDVRGTYAPTTTMNAANVISASFVFNPDALGGLHGQAQA